MATRQYLVAFTESELKCLIEAVDNSFTCYDDAIAIMAGDKKKLSTANKAVKKLKDATYG